VIWSAVIYYRFLSILDCGTVRGIVAAVADLLGYPTPAVPQRFADVTITAMIFRVPAIDDRKKAAINRRSPN